ncbi:MAG TPA: glutamine-hydrolyzing GMP synthase [Actinomyces sp.]|nr:glutamine-hydrolyzing GMP synthase [Actinomyces sp.]
MLNRPVLVVDFGAQYAQLIARRIREAQVYSEIVPNSMTADEMLAKEPTAIILSGGPASVLEDGAPSVDPKIFEVGVPVLGISYGFQAMAKALGGKVEQVAKSENRQVPVRVLTSDSAVLGADGDQEVWVTHGDAVVEAPSGFTVTAESDDFKIAAFEDEARKLYGVQWRPEEPKTKFGQEQIDRFLRDAAGIQSRWTPTSIIDDQVKKIREQIGSARVICGLSGGVDSSVAAALVHKAVGDQLTCIFVDHGLLRAGEREQVERDYAASMGIRVVSVDESDRFLDALAGVTEPEQKRKIIGREFIRSFEAAQRALVEEAGRAGEEIKFLVQGTLYPDVVESAGADGTANIKSHHNVGGLPEDLKFELVEPLRELFKDEVRAIGRELGVPASIVNRQPFPGPGLGIRLIGEITRERLEILRAADLIVREELTKAGMDEVIWQCPVVLLADVRSVGVTGDKRTYGHPIVLRPVISEDAMSADWARLPYDVLDTISTKITDNVEEVNRVVLDVTRKPPGTIEWE